jgi:hypothetical protein
MPDAAFAANSKPTVAMHFANRSPEVRLIYDRILTESKRFGRVIEDPKKTSIHLNNRVAFAGIQTRRESLVLTLKSIENIDSGRIAKHEQASANRWYLDLKIVSPEEIDDELIKWLSASYQLSS